MATAEAVNEAAPSADVFVCYWAVVICVGRSIWLLNYSVVSRGAAVSVSASCYSTVVPLSV